MFREKGYYTGPIQTSNFDETEPLYNTRKLKSAPNAIAKYNDNILLHITEKQYHIGRWGLFEQSIPRLAPLATENGVDFDSSSDVKFLVHKNANYENVLIFLIANLRTSGQLVLSNEQGLEIRSNKVGLQLLTSACPEIRGDFYFGCSHKTHKPPRMNGVAKELVIVRNVDVVKREELTSYFENKWNLNDG